MVSILLIHNSRAVEHQEESVKFDVMAAVERKNKDKTRRCFGCFGCQFLAIVLFCPCNFFTSKGKVE